MSKNNYDENNSKKLSNYCTHGIRRKIMRKKILSSFKLLSTLLLISTLLATTSYALQSQEEWDTAFSRKFVSQDPMLGDPGASPGEEYAWQGSYWVRAYVSMANAFNDTKYLDKAVKLIDVMFYYRDDARQARGAINMNTDYYQVNAPLYYLKNPQIAAPSWRRIWSDQRRIEVLLDGMITQSIMRFVDSVLSNPKFAAYQAKANSYVVKVKETVDIWDDSFAYDRYGAPGSYWYPRADGSGLTSTDVPFNHSATMGTTLLLLDKFYGGNTEYGKKALAVLNYWKQSRREVSENAYDWNYYFSRTGGEDVGHGHIDIGFIFMAHRFGLVTDNEMQLIANTLKFKVYLGSGVVANYLDGTSEGPGYWLGFDWIDLSKFDSRALEIAEEVYNTKYVYDRQARVFLGWADILRWKNQPNNAISPPKNLTIQPLN